MKIDLRLLLALIVTILFSTSGFAQHYFTIKQLEKVAFNRKADNIYTIRDFVGRYGFASSKLYSDHNTFFDQHGNKLETWQLDSKTNPLVKDFVVNFKIKNPSTERINYYKNYLNRNYRKLASTYFQDGKYVVSFKHENSELKINVYNNMFFTFDIPAKKIGLNKLEVTSFTNYAGVSLKKGQKLNLTASGSITLGVFAGSSSPNGIKGYTLYNAVANFPHGSLLGKFGKNGRWFLIGSNKTIVANENTSLRLKINDKDPTNNSGKYILQYSIDGVNMSTNTVSSSPNSQTGCISGNCENGYGKIKYNNGTYSGAFKNGFRHGKGFYKWTNGNSYNGNWVNGKKHGFGIFDWAEGDHYEGHYAIDKRKDGFALYRWKNGDQYQGDFVNNQMEGRGVLTYASTGKKYNGSFLKNKKHGKGREYDRNGKLLYDGQWENGQKINASTITSTNANKNTGCVSGNCQDGYGEYSYSNGYHRGFYKNGKRHGYGHYSWNNGEFYFGDWSNGSRNGYGEHYWNNNSSYVGEWKNNIISGNGYKRNPDKTLSGGIWQNGKLIVTYNFYDNKVKVGCTNGDCKNGFGKYFWKNGDSFVGFFVNSKRILGKYRYANGVIYQGQFATDGSFSGSGYYLWENGSFYRGGFYNYKRNGLGYYKNQENNSKMIGEWENGKLFKSYR